MSEEKRDRRRSRRTNRMEENSELKTKKQKIKIKNTDNLKNIVIAVLAILVVVFGIYTISNVRNRNPKAVLTGYLSELKKDPEYANLKYTKTAFDKEVDKIKNKDTTYKITEIKTEKKENDPAETEIAKATVRRKQKNYTLAINLAKEELRQEELKIDDPKYNGEFIKRLKKHIKDAESVEQEANIELRRDKLNPDWVVTNTSVFRNVGN